ncbi:MAG: DASS family sodium-coupled anion symporter [Nitrospirae bacterium]|nr:DASS family sodium-coupled anion symporter [Nitrospirota bacterium]
MSGATGGGTPRSWLRPRKAFGLVLGAAAFAAVLVLPSELHVVPAFGDRPARAAAVAVLMAVLWFTEAIPMSWTACLPLVLFPALGVFGGTLPGDVPRSLEPYVDAYIFLFLGGMMIGAAMEQSNLHRRVALHVLRAIGTDPARLLLGMLVATAGISLWISNTATAVIMMPIGLALLRRLEAGSPEGRAVHFGTALMLAVAYGANVGGIGTKIGTGTNSIFCGFASREMGIEIGFGEYVAMALPFVALFLPLVWLVLWRVGRRDRLSGSLGRAVLDVELRALGKMTPCERKVAAVFGGAALLWIAGDLIRPVLAPHVPEFWPGFKFQNKHYEAWVAMGGGLTLMAWRALSWRSVQRIPWGTLLLLGGSFALASGIEGSGLAVWLTGRLGALAELPLLHQVGLAAASTIALSALASNTATINVMLNILPRHMTVLTASTIAASCDFMLPVGTPPNAIVFGSGYVRLPVMMKVGALLDLLAAGLVTLYTGLYLRLFFST